MSEGRAVAVVRCSTRLLLLAAAACQGSSDFMSGAAVPEPGTQGRIVVDVRWDLGTSGQLEHRAIWLGPVDDASAAWQRIELDADPDDKGAAWLALCNVYRDRCWALSEQAFDMLRADSGGTLPSNEYVVTYGRKNHQVVPSPDLSRVVILDREDGQRGMIELPSLYELPWPAGVNWGIAGRGRISKGTRAAWSADGARFAVVVDDSVLPDPDTVPQVRQRVFVFDSRTCALQHEFAVNRWVTELAWGTDGAKLALLVFDYRSGTGLVERLGAAIGHERPYEKVYVQIFDLGSGSITESLLVDWIPDVTAHIVWDPQAVTARPDWKLP